MMGRRINFIFAVKQANDGKVNSHRYFYEGICRYLNPKYCMMLDCGTKPVDYALAKLYKYMDHEDNKDCGGCCGEIEVEFEESYDGWFWPKVITSAQYFEYKIGHMPDKASESLSGFISVLPGAYTLFRWETIKGKPLELFF